ncbi:MAG TPA: DUF952 domain-containing protein [Solirubrobacteraceae bacterium]|nr:DUF952 domain-containing protein [Solirubrobacteraceae bacterium]
MIFHIAPESDWEAAIAAGAYAADSLSTEGFIHFSNAEQVARVAGVRFSGRDDLLLLCVEPERLRAPLRYEPGAPDSQELFPHLYGPLELDAVAAVRRYRAGAEGFPTPMSDGLLDMGPGPGAG